MAAKNRKHVRTRLIGSPAGCSAAESRPKEGLYPGMLLKDRYLIEKELGRGGIGVVYLGRDQQLLSRPVVVRVLLNESDQNNWFKKKFRQEIEALARIDHPGVVGVLDAGQTQGGKLYLVMQFVSGIDLRTAMPSVPMIVRHEPYTKLKSGSCLTIIGTEGRSEN